MKGILIRCLLVLMSGFAIQARASAWGEAAPPRAGTAGTDSLLDALSDAISNADKFDKAKEEKIQGMRESLRKAQETGNQPAVYRWQDSLYEEYKIFHYDSAYEYATRMLQQANRQPDPVLREHARLKLGFILLSSGLFREAFDTIQAVKVLGLPDSLKGEYYILMGRYYFDLANYDFDGHYHSIAYDELGARYIDSALKYYPESSFEYQYYSGLKHLKQGEQDKASDFLKRLLPQPLSDHQLALTASTLAGIYRQQGQPDSAMDMMIQAAIADIRSSTKETYAVFILADQLFRKGDVKHASMSIEAALANAEFYGARQRKVQVSSVLSLIESERINAVEAQRRILIKYAVLVTLLLIALAVLIIVIRKQVLKLQKAQKLISEAHAVQREINAKLGEANKIKEEYIGYFFNLDSEFFLKLERLKRTLDQKLDQKKFDDIRFIVNNIHLKKEKEDLLRSFDTVFLKIFPQFVTTFNSLFREEDQIKLKENELLNMDLRIFALIRMGITDNEKIAQILGYSVNTIYTYKTRLKNKALIPNDQFEARIMEISSV